MMRLPKPAKPKRKKALERPELPKPGENVDHEEIRKAVTKKRTRKK